MNAAAGTCQYCGCTEENACAVGCAWADESRITCTACSLGASIAKLMLDLVKQVYAEFPGSAGFDHLYTHPQRQVLVVGSRAIFEALPSSVEENFNTLVAEMRELIDALQARHPQAIERAVRERKTIAQIVLDLLDGKGRIVLVGG